MLQRRMPGRLMGSVPLWGGGLGAFKFDPALVTFTPGMAKRTSAGPFETAPIVQGAWDVADVADNISFAIGTPIQKLFYPIIDMYQGSVVFWITPEWNGNDNLTHFIYRDDSAKISVYKSNGNSLSVAIAEIGVNVDVSAWTAGTTYQVVARWDSKNTLDGTNYGCISINNVHTFGDSASGTPEAPGTVRIGNASGTLWQANAIIEGLTIYRRPLFDGTYGVAANWDDSGPIDEIEEIYNAGAGADPCLITGSWDVVFCLPTDSTAGALVTGTGEAWSHPHSSGVLKHQWLEDGGYLGRPWAVLFNGITTLLNCGSGATLDDLPTAVFTAEAWVRPDDWGEGGNGGIFNKGRATSGGWRLITQEGLSAITAEIDFVTANATAQVSFTPDGKLHHFALYFDQGGDDKLYIAIDGVWASTYISQIAANGAHVTDAADDFTIGCRDDGQQTFDGVIGWVAISDNDRYSHGTDFIPPRQPPATDGNHVEMWHLDEGTGALINAEVTSPANDGTLANGVWEEQWDIETTPIVPYSVEFDESTDGNIAFGSAAAIDDLHDAELTVECWVRKDPSGANLTVLITKGGSPNGWNLLTEGTTYPRFQIPAATTGSTSTATMRIDDDKWHHLVGYFNDAGGADRKAYLAVDGIWQTPGALMVGAVISDAGDDLYMGRRSSANDWLFKGGIAYGRLSDNDRFTHGVNFIPPSRLNPPGVDGNTVAQWNFRDGAGTTLLDETANNIDGTIDTGCSWRITPDMEIDSPGERVFNWGYGIGNDAVDEGIKETLSGLDAGQNYVVRAIAHVESASRGRPKIIIYDETNGAEITALEGPSFTGVHDGLANAATLTDTTARFPQMLVGWTIYNITDVSSATVTAVSGDMQDIIGALSGGTDDDWDIGDEYRLVPPGGPSEYDDYPWIETFTFELPTIARNGAAADCVSISVKLVNGVNEGVIKWHQIELLENEVDNPSLETGAGNPWLPDGWTNYNYAAGEATQDAAVFHSGASSLNLAAAASRWMGYNILGLSVSKFYSSGIWMMEISGSIRVSGLGGSAMLLQAANTNWIWLADQAVWKPYIGVVRCEAVGATLLTRGANPHDGNFDDQYLFACDDVSLTVTPASEVNSAESGGLRVDGWDDAPQPILAGVITETAGDIRAKVTPRHDIADMDNFGNLTPVLFHVFGDATNYIFVELSAANTIRLRFNDGGGEHLGVWAAGGALLADTDYIFRVKWSTSEMSLIVDGTTQITIAQPVNFGTVPTQFYPGSRQAGDYQIDAVFSAP